jgi:hypothetical protein
MYIRKNVLALSIVLSLLVGVAAGFGGGYYKYVSFPKKQAVETARKQQEELQKMVRSGEAVAVDPDKITVKVEKGGGDVGQTITARTNEYTSVQVGMGFVSRPGEKLDLTKWFKAGDQVDVLYKDGQALALHRELRPGEQQPQPMTPTAPVQVQQQGQPQQPAPGQGQK